jgi:antitoxin (DNA-binding transcriptional repressor) of toxin-antitoxin stability system
MPTVNMHEAKTSLSRLVADLESGAETEIIIARNGKPAARLVPIDVPDFVQPATRRLGIAEGMFAPFDYEAFQARDTEIEMQMLEGDLFPPDTSVVQRKKQA